MMQTNKDAIEKATQEVEEISRGLLSEFKKSPSSQHTALLIYSLASMVYRVNGLEEEIGILRDRISEILGKK